jgi:hypothetical protein
VLVVDEHVQQSVVLAAPAPSRCPSGVVEETAVVDSSFASFSAILINQLIPSLFSALDAAGWWFACSREQANHQRV